MNDQEQAAAALLLGSDPTSKADGQARSEPQSKVPMTLWKCVTLVVLYITRHYDRMDWRAEMDVCVKSKVHRLPGALFGRPQFAVVRLPRGRLPSPVHHQPVR